MVIHLEDNKDKQNRKYKKWFEVGELNNVQTHYTEHRNGKEIYMRNS